MATNKTDKPALRRLDHCVLPVAELDVARARYEQLGFTVAPEGKHPFGTRNACVYFSDNTFLEPLAVGDAKSYAAASEKQNTFVARDRAYRFRRGEEGFSAIALASDDAGADHAGFRNEGISAGRIVRFSRAARDPGGASDIASFRLAFAADLRAPDMFFFTCERVRVPAVNRSALEIHANGATGIREVVMSEAKPADFAGLVERMTGSQPEIDYAGNLRSRLGSCIIRVLGPADLEKSFRLKAGRARGLRFRAVEIGVADLDKTRAVLENNGVLHDQTGECIVVPPYKGQGACLSFTRNKES